MVTFGISQQQRLVKNWQTYKISTLSLVQNGRNYKRENWHIFEKSHILQKRENERKSSNQLQHSSGVTGVTTASYKQRETSQRLNVMNSSELMSLQQQYYTHLYCNMIEVITSQHMGDRCPGSRKFRDLASQLPSTKWRSKTQRSSKTCSWPSRDDGMWNAALCHTPTGRRSVWNMRWRAPDQEVDQRGRGERLCKKTAKHTIWTGRMLQIAVGGRSW